MLRSIGLPELVVIFCLPFCLMFVVVPFWKIFSKAGYPGIMGLMMVVPLLNLIMLFFLAFSEWPVLRELNALKHRTTSTLGPPVS